MPGPPRPPSVAGQAAAEAALSPCGHPFGCDNYRMPAGAGPVFRRDLPTRLCYAAVAAYAFWLYAFGPALALLRVELHISYTMIGVYSALWAGGAALAGER